MNVNLRLLGLGLSRPHLRGLSSTVEGLNQCGVCKYPSIQSEMVFGPPSAVTGTLTRTLANATLASADSVGGVTGTLTRTLDNATVASAGSVATSPIGTLTRTLANATVSSAGSIANGPSGTLTRTLANATVASAGSVATSPIGTLTRTLANATLASAGSIANGPSGTLTRTLANATVASAGNVANNDPIGTLFVSLNGATLASAGNIANGPSGTLTRTLADATLQSIAIAVSNDDLDDMSDIIEANAELIGYTFAGSVGQCRAWWGRQDREVKRVDGARLAFTKRDLMVVRADLPREPKAGDQFSAEGVWTVRPRGDDCFTASDRRAKLLRVYVTK